MDILHVCTHYWPSSGGIENYVREISQRLVADGHRVQVATSDAWDSDAVWNPGGRRVTDEAVEHHGVTIHRFAVRQLLLAPQVASAWRVKAMPLLAGLPLGPGLLAWLSRRTPWIPGLQQWLRTTTSRFDVVAVAGVFHANLLEAAAAFAGRCQARLLAYPFTHLGAGATPGCDCVSRNYTMRHQTALLRCSDAVITMTPTERDFYIRQGLSPATINVAGAGVRPLEPTETGDAARFRDRHGIRGPVVAFLSSVTTDKGAGHLVEAARRLWRDGSPLHLVLAGKRFRRFDHVLAGLSAGETLRLHLLGEISEPEKHDLFAAADVLAMPSRTDSFGIVFLEAWLHRKPVIGSTAWGMSDLIADGIDGCLVPFGDVQALAETLAGLLAQPELRAAMGERGERKALSQYTWDHVYARVRPLYNPCASC
jgi:glycosyltransferase involved in cell wall biosynthesis